MRHGRGKQARRTLQFFQRTIGIHSPYNVVVDGTFTVAMLQAKLPLQERLERLLQHGSKYQLFMTQSSLKELELLEQHARKKSGTDDDENVFQQAREWAQHNCRILLDMPQSPEQLDQAKAKYQIRNQDQPKDGEGKRIRKRRGQEPALELTEAQNDMLRLVTDANSASKGTDKTSSSKQHEAKDGISKGIEKKATKKSVYFVATQDEIVLGVLRYFPVPLIRLAHGSVLLLEQPSKMIQTQDKWTEEQKWNATSSGAVVMTQQEQELIKEVAVHQKQEERNEQAKKAVLVEPGRQPTQKKHKAKGPNPLSCKRKKDTGNNAGKQRGKRQKASSD